MEERTDMEIWKPIDYIGDGETYEVSNLGRVRNRKTGKMKKQRFKGFLQVAFPQYKKVYSVAKLVLRAFDPVSDEPFNVDYKDGNTTNCRLNNLAWLYPKRKTENVTQPEIRPEGEEWRPIKEIGNGETYEVSNLGRVRNRKTGRIREPNIFNGVFRVCFHGGQTYNVAKLVLRVFRPDEKESFRVEYLDGDKTNCRLDNLRWKQNPVQRKGFESMKCEEWRPIKEIGDGETYEVSNFGRVRNRETGKIKKTRFYGSLKVGFLHGGNVCSVGKLVLRAFAPAEHETYQVEYLDGDKTNCCLENLRWKPGVYKKDSKPIKDKERKPIEGKKWEPIEGEEWRPIKEIGDGETCEVSNLGRVREKFGTYGYVTLEPQLYHDTMYVYVEGKRWTLSRLVLRAFDPVDEEPRFVYFIDNDRTNCRLENLRWLYPKKDRRTTVIPSEEKTSKIVLGSEEWRPIDYIGDGKTYEVSNYGRVRRIKDVRVQRIDGAVLIYRKGILQGHAAKGQITIEHSNYSTAKLVLRAFDPLADEPGRVDYLDGDNTNCRLDNIRWHMDRIQKASESGYKVTIPPSEELQQGDKVKIIRPEYNDPGCPWLDGMNKYIGKTMTIRYISKGGLVQMEEDYRRGDGNGEGYVWPKEACVPVENQVSIVPRRRWKIGDYVRSVTDYYADCPRGWCGYVEQTDERGRPGMMKVTGFGEHYWVRQSDFVRIKTPTDPKVGDRVSIIDIGKMYPYNTDWLVEHNIDQETMCRFSFGHLPFVQSTKSVKCYVPAVIIAVDGKTCLVESTEDRSVYLVDVTGLTTAKETRGKKK